MINVHQMKMPSTSIMQKENCLYHELLRSQRILKNQMDCTKQDRSFNQLNRTLAKGLLRIWLSKRLQSMLGPNQHWPGWTRKPGRFTHVIKMIEPIQLETHLKNCTVICRSWSNTYLHFEKPMLNPSNHLVKNYYIVQLINNTVDRLLFSFT